MHFLLILAIFCIGRTSTLDYILERVESLNDTNTAHVYFNFHVKQINHKTYSINGNITFREHFKKNAEIYSYSVHVYKSSLNNNPHKKSTVTRQLPTVNYCVYSNVSNYQRYFTKTFRAPASDVPYSVDDADEIHCNAYQPDQELYFHMNNVLVDPADVKKTEHKDPGLFRAEILFEFDDIVIGSIASIGRIEVERKLKRF